MESKSKIRKKPSKLWYLLPIAFSFWGGIHGYNVLKERDEKMAKLILIIGFIVLFIQVSIAIYLIYWSETLLSSYF